MRQTWCCSVFFAFALAFTGVNSAYASAICAQIEAQLQKVTLNGASSSNYKRFAQAAKRQSDNLDRVRADISRYGCSSGSIIVLGGQNAQTCQKLATFQTKMRVNLAALERKRDSFAKVATKVAKRKLQAALRANDCNGKDAKFIEASLNPAQELTPERKPTRSSAVTVIKNGTISSIIPTSSILPGSNAPSRSRIIIEPGTSRGGQYRTLCVRTCDGFFFPISSNAQPSDFARDEKTCQMMCPGTQTALYFRDALNQETEDMMSARTQEPYIDMPNAFAYRNTNAPSNKACGCNMSAFYKEMARREALLANTTTTTAPQTTWVRPLNRPEPGEDPETIINTESPLSANDVAAVLAASTTPRPLTQKRKSVRMVGPVFFPDSSEKLDLKHPRESFLR